MPAVYVPYCKKPEHPLPAPNENVAGAPLPKGITVTANLVLSDKESTTAKLNLPAACGTPDPGQAIL